MPLLWVVLALVVLFVIYKLPRTLSLLCFCAIGVVVWVLILREGYGMSQQLTRFMNDTFNRVSPILER